MNWLLLKNSLLVGGLATGLAVGLGFMAALFLTGLAPRWRSLSFALTLMALALPPFLVTNCWIHYLGQAGVWHRWLPLQIYSLGGTVWLLGLSLWPLTVLAVSSAWRRLEPAQLESDMAVTGWNLIRGLLFPLARISVGQAALLTFVLALNNFAVPAILQVKVFPAEMWVKFNTTFDTPGALKLSWPLVLGPLLLLFWLARRELPWPHLEAPVPAGLFRQQLGPAWYWACGAGTAALLALALGLPLVQLLSLKRTWTELPGALAAGQTAVWNSFWFAAASASLVVIAGLLKVAVAQSERRRKAKTQNPKGSDLSFVRGSAFGFRIVDLLWLPFLLPGVLLGIGLIVAFNHSWSAALYQSGGIVVVAFVIRYLAPGWNAVAHAAQSLDPDLTDVARLEGANRWQMLRHVHWPQLRPQVSAAWYIIFLLCLWDVESMVLIVPPGGETLALRIFNLLHYGYNAQVNALCLTLLGVAVAPMLAFQLWCAARSAFSKPPVLAMVGLCGSLFLAGCSPNASSNTAPLRSGIFARVQVIFARGVGVGQLNKPRSVAVDNQDNLYVIDMTGRVQKFSPAGNFLLSWQLPQTDLGKPKGMCRDLDGNIVVIEPHYQRLNHFTPLGRLVEQWGQKGTNSGQFIMPRAAAMDSHHEMFVSEYGVVERVQKFAFIGADGQRLVPPRFLASFGRPGTGPGEFNRPEGLCIDAQDRLHVADSCNHRIEIFSSDGTFLRAYGKPGKGKGELSYPYDICVDAAGRQYVCEFGNGRIQIFDAQDQPLEIIGVPGAAPGQFSNPWGVALDSAGNLYVADSQNHRVQKLIRRP